MFPALKDAEGRLEAKCAELAGIFAQAGPEVDLAQVKGFGSKDDVLGTVRSLNEEINALGAEVENLKAVERAADSVKGYAPQGESKTEYKSFADAFIASDAYRRKGREAKLDIELKTTMSLTAGWAAEDLRIGRVIENVQRPVQVTDLFPTASVSTTNVLYMSETTFTNNAAEVAEAGAYGEAALALTEVSEPVRKIAVFLPVTDEQLEDEPAVRGYINQRLPFMLRQRLDSQLLVGNGTAPNLSGILDRAGIQTQAKGTDPTPDAVYKAITKVRVTGRANPTAVIFHPNDWQDVRLLRTADGLYIWGNPSEAGPERIWGLPVVVADAITENTALVGDFAGFSQLYSRRGIDVQVSNSHSDFFVNGKQAIRADMRVALAVYREAAFCQVTGV